MRKVTKKLFTISAAFLLVLCSLTLVQETTDVTFVPTVSAGNTATENMTEMIEDLMPSFVMLIFIMVLMMIMLTIADKITKK